MKGTFKSVAQKKQKERDELFLLVEKITNDMFFHAFQEFDKEKNCKVFDNNIYKTKQKINVL